MRPYWITFGQIHTHSINGITFDKDCVALIHATDKEAARDNAFELFGNKFCFIKEFEPDMSFYPRGIIKL